MGLEQPRTIGSDRTAVSRMILTHRRSVSGVAAKIGEGRDEQVPPDGCHEHRMNRLIPKQCVGYLDVPTTRSSVRLVPRRSYTCWWHGDASRSRYPIDSDGAIPNRRAMIMRIRSITVRDGGTIGFARKPSASSPVPERCG